MPLTTPVSIPDIVAIAPVELEPIPIAMLGVAMGIGVLGVAAPGCFWSLPPAPEPGVPPAPPVPANDLLQCVRR
eukprot:1273604-Amorphochlora_amoeboformis.AAC.2